MSGRRVWVMGLVMSGFYDLLKDVDAGAFDDLDVPGIQLLGARGQTVGWMKLDFEDLLVDDDS